MGIFSKNNEKKTNTYINAIISSIKPDVVLNDSVPQIRYELSVFANSLQLSMKNIMIAEQKALSRCDDFLIQFPFKIENQAFLQAEYAALRRLVLVKICEFAPPECRLFYIHQSTDILKSGFPMQSASDDLVKSLYIFNTDEYCLDRDYFSGFYKEVKKSNFLLNYNTTGSIPFLEGNPLNIIYKNDERLYYFCKMHFMKKKKVRVNTSHQSGHITFRISKHVAYTLGGGTSTPIYTDDWIKEDIGDFWISNQRIGFMGNKNGFVISINQIASIIGGDGGIHIYKEGRQNTYILYWPDMDIVCTVLSYAINNAF